LILAPEKVYKRRFVTNIILQTVVVTYHRLMSFEKCVWWPEEISTHVHYVSMWWKQVYRWDSERFKANPFTWFVLAFWIQIYWYQQYFMQLTSTMTTSVMICLHF